MTDEIQQTERGDGAEGSQAKPKGDYLLGTMLSDRYEILSVLGRGGMGVVYKGRRTLIDRFVAIKVLSEQLLDSDISKKRFMQEAKASARLNHPHLISVFDYGFTDYDEPYLVMDFLEGESLEDLFQRVHILPIDRFLKIFQQSCKALNYIHKMGLVHRDLKPSNIMLVPTDDDPDFIKLVDFGIAKVLPTGEGTIQRLTATGQSFGSPLYMSPEQCQGKDVDSRADIYSLGCVMFEMLTGTPPICGDNPLQTLFLHVTQKPVSFAEANPNVRVPLELQKVLLKCLEKEPNNRYQTASELSEALTDAILMDSSIRKEVMKDGWQVYKKGVPLPSGKKAPPPLPSDGALKSPPPLPELAPDVVSARGAGADGAAPSAVDSNPRPARPKAPPPLPSEQKTSTPPPPLPHEEIADTVPMEGMDQKLSTPPPPLPEQKTSNPPPQLPEQKTSNPPPPLPEQKTSIPPPPLPEQKTSNPPPPLPEQKTSIPPPPLPEQKTSNPPPPLPVQEESTPPIVEQKQSYPPPPVILEQKTSNPPLLETDDTGSRHSQLDKKHTEPRGNWFTNLLEGDGSPHQKRVRILILVGLILIIVGIAGISASGLTKYFEEQNYNSSAARADELLSSENYSEAVTAYTDLLSKAEAKYGSTSLTYEQVLYKLALAMHKSGQNLDSVKDKLLSCLTILQSCSDPKSNPDFGDVTFELGCVYEQQDKISDAKGYFEQSLDSRKGLYGNDSPKTALAQWRLGQIYWRNWETSRAIDTLGDALAFYKSQQVRDYKALASVALCLASARARNHEITTAKDLLREADGYVTSANDSVLTEKEKLISKEIDDFESASNQNNANIYTDYWRSLLGSPLNSGSGTSSGSASSTGTSGTGTGTTSTTIIGPIRTGPSITGTTITGTNSSNSLVRKWDYTPGKRYSLSEWTATGRSGSGTGKSPGTKPGGTGVIKWHGTTSSGTDLYNWSGSGSTNSTNSKNSTRSGSSTNLFGK